MLIHADEPPIPEKKRFEGESLLEGAIIFEENPLSEEEIFQWVEQYVPSGVSELKDLKQEAPEVYAHRIREVANEIRHLETVKQRDPEMFERLVKAENLEHKSWKLSGEIARTQDPEKKKQLTAQLKDMLGEIFEIRLEERSLEIKELENEINKIKTLIEERKANKGAIIDRHLNEMLSEHDETLMWW
jgi:hypothetical protein